jgi:type I restriction enzyme, S subunit
MSFPVVGLSSVLKQRKEFIIIDDDTEYKLCRVQTNRKGVVLRSLLKGSEIMTKRQQVCRAGDFIVATIDAKVGGYGFVPAELNGAIVSNDYQLYNLELAKLYPDYLRMLITTELIQDQIRPSGTTNHARTHSDVFLKAEIPLPSVPEQQAIAEKFDRISRETVVFDFETASADSLLTSLRQAILQDAVSGKLVPQNPSDEPASELLKKIRAEKAKMVKEGTLRKEKPLPPINPDEVPFDLPPGWEWCRLGEIVEVLMGSSPDGSSYNNEGEGVPLVNGPVEFGEGDLGKTRLLKYTTEPSVMCSSGDILLCVRGSTTGRLNIAGFDACIGRGVAALRPSIDRFYFTLILLILRQKIYDKGRGSTFPNVTKDEIVLFSLAIPPLPEQHRIVAKARQLLAQCDEMERALQQSRNLANALKLAIVHGLVGE